MSEELKTCPFCGCEAHVKRIKRRKFFKKIINTDTDDYVYIRCSVCAATSSVQFTEEEARTAWNTRYNPEPKFRCETCRHRKKDRNDDHPCRECVDHEYWE